MECNPVPAFSSPVNDGSLVKSVLSVEPNIQVPFCDIAYNSDRLNASCQMYEEVQESIDPTLLMASPYLIGIQQISLFPNLSPSEYKAIPNGWPQRASPDSSHAPSFKEDETLPSHGPTTGPRPLSDQFFEPPPPETPISAGTPVIEPPTPSSPAKDKDPCARSVSPRNARYACEDCGIFSKTRRDHNRHLNTNKHKLNVTRGAPSAGPSGIGVHCPVTGCKFHRTTPGGRMLSREDNLWRHIKKVHGMEMSR
ncbi:hypothetical protein SMACR_07704 [Sordaria macrospora]|uniref:WGS project CABT00000000 data, contig 2.27 n=2 Tax=Sordaria macrospora TaxID=5147 RepID=F7W4E6_SORMK|nr:uncharacterized protein SMAC_07704 [Sordaria macrospora k-hell]KAA8634891.1 hypothetical protein SMACR_07704 [Sordaria macrospora]KAH7635466.1 hypothetical protein B0T09DRAFT_23554 [Sordaria sp. MPI-SDFR-AT-0083]WPJ67398.1 hypothetical protein SMAC4_07704 [Sordaria macrospora]CCC14899.1 unnamed protein product [Sordaria macrospora k-hell]